MNPVQVFYDPKCDKLFQNQHHGDFQRWINQNHRFQVYGGDVIDFDQAFVLQVMSTSIKLPYIPSLNSILTLSSNGLHTTTSTYDPNPANHATVRLTNPDLRSKRMWYTLHWRLGNDSVFLEKPDDEYSHAQRKAKRKGKKQRQQEKRNTPSQGAASSSQPTHNPANDSTNFAFNSIEAGPTVTPPRGPVPTYWNTPAGGNYAHYTTAPTGGAPSTRGTAPSHGSVPQYAPLPTDGNAPTGGTAPTSSTSTDGSFASHGSVPQYTAGPGRGVTPSQGNASTYGFSPAARTFSPAGTWSQHGA